MEFKSRKKPYAQESASDRTTNVIKIYTPVFDRLASFAKSHGSTNTDEASRLLKKALDEYSAETRKKLNAQESASDRTNNDRQGSKGVRIYTPVFDRLASFAKSHGLILTDIASRLLEKKLDEYSAEKRSDH